MFLSSIKASAGDRSPWGSFWFQPIGMRSISGMRVTADSAMRLSAVYSCVRVLSETAGAAETGLAFSQLAGLLLGRLHLLLVLHHPLHDAVLHLGVECFKIGS